MKEIGSEFWKINNNDLVKKSNIEFFTNLGIDTKFFMSGRTAIDYVLKNIEDKIKIVYMPNYCCNSMVQPFIDNGYNIKYYKVDLINKKYYIDEKFNCSIFYGMSYFGYEDSNMDNYIKKFKIKNVIVLEDITHRILCKKNHCEKSDYLIASLRKWFPIYTGAIAVNKDYLFKKDINQYSVDEKLVRYKKEAMNLKQKYISGETKIDKKKFLELYNKSNEMIKDYINKKIDNESLEILKYIDIQKYIEQRVRNVQVLEKKISEINNVRLLFRYKTR